MGPIWKPLKVVAHSGSRLVLTLFKRGRHALEEIEPCDGKGIADVVGSAQLLERAPPIEADPSAGVGLGFLDELFQLIGVAVQGEDFLDDDGFADVELSEQ